MYFVCFYIISTIQKCPYLIYFYFFLERELWSFSTHITMFFLPVVLLLLSGGSASVVQDFQSECGEVFYHRIPPTVFPVPRFRQICQTQNNLYYYATLYDTLNKIPVYSAYVFTRWVECRRSSSWYIEPQVCEILLMLDFDPTPPTASYTFSLLDIERTLE